MTEPVHRDCGTLVEMLYIIYELNDMSEWEERYNKKYDLW